MTDPEADALESRLRERVRDKDALGIALVGYDAIAALRRRPAARTEPQLDTTTVFRGDLTG